MLIGTNREEWKLFRIGDPRRRLTHEDLERRLRRTLSGTGHAEAALELYRPDPAVRRRATPEDAWVAFQSDRVFHQPAGRLADAHASAGGRTYTYLFTWRPPLFKDRLGSCHALEIPFVFGTLRARALRPWLLASPGAARLSDRMQDAWVAFARSGDPWHSGLPAGRHEAAELSHQDDQRDLAQIGALARHVGSGQNQDLVPSGIELGIVGHKAIRASTPEHRLHDRVTPATDLEALAEIDLGPYPSIASCHFG